MKNMNTARRTESIKETLGNLLQNHAGKALSFARSLTGNQAEAEELVQQASYQALRHWRRYDPLKRFENWYLTMVKNLFIDARRRLAWRNSVSLSAPVYGYEGRCLAEVVADVAPGPLEQMERKQLIAATRKALKALSTEYKAVLTLCDLEGISYEETARKLGLPMGTVRSRLARARALLRRDLGIRRTI